MKARKKDKNADRIGMLYHFDIEQTKENMRKFLHTKLIFEVRS